MLAKQTEGHIPPIFYSLQLTYFRPQWRLDLNGSTANIRSYPLLTVGLASGTSALLVMPVAYDRKSSIFFARNKYRQPSASTGRIRSGGGVAGSIYVRVGSYIVSWNSTKEEAEEKKRRKLADVGRDFPLKLRYPEEEEEEESMRTVLCRIGLWPLSGLRLSACVD